MDGPGLPARDDRAFAGQTSIGTSDTSPVGCPARSWMRMTASFKGPVERQKTLPASGRARHARSGRPPRPRSQGRRRGRLQLLGVTSWKPEWTSMNWDIASARDLLAGGTPAWSEQTTSRPSTVIRQWSPSSSLSPAPRLRPPTTIPASPASSEEVSGAAAVSLGPRRAQIRGARSPQWEAWTRGPHAPGAGTAPSRWPGRPARGRPNRGTTMGLRFPARPFPIGLTVVVLLAGCTSGATSPPSATPVASVAPSVAVATPTPTITPTATPGPTTQPASPPGS
jgi:hypothetical protein